MNFLKKASPYADIISCGINNKYGHSGTDTLKRLSTLGIIPFITAENGSITISKEINNIYVTPFINT